MRNISFILENICFLLLLGNVNTTKHPRREKKELCGEREEREREMDE